MTQSPNQIQIPQDEKFLDIPLYQLQIQDVFVKQLAGRKYPSIHIVTNAGVFIIKRRGLTKLMNALGYKRKDILDPEIAGKLKELLREKDNLLLSVVKLDKDKFYVYRITTTEYVAVPHRILFDFASGILRDLGVNAKPEFRRMGRAMVMLVPLYQVPLNYRRVGDAVTIYFSVSNANTGDHSIRVYGYAEILKCKNGLTLKDYTAKIAVHHTTDIQSILSRVAVAIREVIKKLGAKHREIASMIEGLDKIPLDKRAVEVWLQLVKEKTPRKYHDWIEKQLRKNIAEFGYTAQALFQTATYMSSRIIHRNKQLSEYYNKIALELLAQTPSQ